MGSIGLEAMLINAMATVAAFYRLIPGPVALIIYQVVNAYMIIIIVWAVLSWFRTRGGTANNLYLFLDKIVSPYVDIFRKFMPKTGGIDFSPFIAIMILHVIVRLIISI